MNNLSSFKKFSTFLNFFQIGIIILLIVFLALAIGDPGFFKAAVDPAYQPSQRPLFLLFISDYLFLFLLLFAAFQLQKIIQEILREKKVFVREHVKRLRKIGWGLAAYIVLQFAMRAFATIEIKSMMGEIPFDGAVIATLLMELRVDLALLSILLLVMGALFRSGFKLQEEQDWTF